MGKIDEKTLARLGQKMIFAQGPSRVNLKRIWRMSPEEQSDVHTVLRTGDDMPTRHGQSDSEQINICYEFRL